MKRQPVRRHHTIAGTKIHRELLIPAEIGTADSADEIKRARHGAAATDKGLARQEVVAQREVVIREASLRLGKQLDLAQGFEAGLAGTGTGHLALEEEVLGDVVGEGDAVRRVAAEILDRDDAVVGAQLEIGAVDPRYLDLATRDLRLDHPRRRLVFVARCRRILGAAVVEPVVHRRAPRQRRHRGQRRHQKKNANPAFHSSASSFWLRLVKM